MHTTNLAPSRPSLARRPNQPRIFGPYKAIRRDYLIDEYLADLSGPASPNPSTCNAIGRKTVSRTKSPTYSKPPMRPIPASHRRLRRFSGERRPATRPADQISGMRGLRMQLQWHKNPQYQFAPGPDLARDPTLQKNVAHLADYGWSFDLRCSPARCRRRRARRQRAQGDLHLAARRHNRGYFARRLGAMAKKHAAPCLAPECRFEALGARHLHS